MAEISSRGGASQAVIARLAAADAFGSLTLDRRAALWQALDQPRADEDAPLLTGVKDIDDSLPTLPELSPQEQVFADYRSSGLSLRAHPLKFCREQLAALGVTPCKELAAWRHGRSVKVAGLVLMRQRPGTAKGITFVTLEDETGIANLIIHKKTWARFELVARRATALIVTGRLERKDTVIHVIARRIEDLQAELEELRHRSRDFR